VAHRRRLAVALAVLGLAAVTACGGGGGGAAGEATTTTSTPPETTPTTEVSPDAAQVLYVYTPGVGDCFDRRRLEDGPAVLLVDCTQPHTFQVFGVFDFDESTLPPNLVATDGLATTGEGTTGAVGAGPQPWPGEDVLVAAARRQCPGLFAEWVGLPYERSVLELSWVLPDEAAWDSGSRLIGCTLWDPTTERMGTDSRGAAR
jgi:hypothetical protein